MFYVEIVLETTGAIKDVKIAHQEDPVVIIIIIMFYKKLYLFTIHIDVDMYHMP